MPKPCCQTGVYCWKNKVNGKVYVGGAFRSFEKRRARHVNQLRAGCGVNNHLQSAWNKYGEKSFVWCILERCLSHKVEDREAYWIAKLRSTDNRFGYNMCPRGIDRTGVMPTEETRRRMSESHKGRKLTEEHKANLKMGSWARGPNAAEIAERCAAKHRGRKRTGKALANIRAGQKKRWEGYERVERPVKLTPEQVAERQSARLRGIVPIMAVEAAARVNRGKHRPPEVCEKISRAQKGKKLSKEHLANLIANHWSKRPDAADIIERSASKHRGRKQTVESNKKRSVAQKGRPKPKTTRRLVS